MSSLNQVNLIGRVGRDPDIKTTSKGDLYAKFSIATNKWRKTMSGEYDEITQWHNIVVWDPKLAEKVQKGVMKGSLVHVTGEIKTREYEKDGVTKLAVDIEIPRFQGVVNVLLDRKKDSNVTTNDSTPFDLDDIPL